MLLTSLRLEHYAKATLICESGINLPLLAVVNKQENWLRLGSVNEFGQILMYIWAYAVNVLNI